MTSFRGKDVLTTGEVARICHVAPRTVSKWFDTGKLRGYRIPGSRDRRIPLPQLIAFMRAHGMPLDGLDGGFCRILMLSPEATPELSDVLTESAKYEVRVADSGFQAGVLAQQFRPHVVILDVDEYDDAFAICSNFRTIEGLSQIHILAASYDTSQVRQYEEAGFDGMIAKPLAPSNVSRAAESVTNFLQ
ncbi:MAG: helix-turn-helix domain-containing protein [Phycisphaerae bacterium]